METIAPNPNPNPNPVISIQSMFNTYDMEYNPNYSVKDIINTVKVNEPYNEVEMNLTYKSQSMEPMKTLKDYGVNAGDKLYLSHVVYGG